MNVEVGSSESTKGFQYKSSKVCWEIKPKNEEQKAGAIGVLSEVLAVPLYSSLLVTYDGNHSNQTKYYANFTYIPLAKFCAQQNHYDLYIEENIFIGQINFNGISIENPSILKMLETFGFTEENLYDQSGIKRIPYEEYMNLRFDEEISKELVNE